MNKENPDGIISNICNDTITLIDATKDISSLLQIWAETNSGTKELEEVNDKIKAKIKNYLKERGWSRYKDTDTKINVSISEITKEVIDKPQLKMMLSESQYAQVSNLQTYERMNIITEKKRLELMRIVRK